ncbi:MAG: disulfide bond formation protein DsbA [Rhizobiales bacterium 63-7]|uniref:DsbA family protein n=1 Tax=Rhizobium sp. YJ-22 TaxID=3037556 RepID=UPI00092A6F3D|nr:DsbA family protein [Rhizobium sp. YJ-22]MBN9028406.1 DsbA family protein [Hyphomicrobiales bacterium]MDG3577043.1 DsbA family protein [Rhizobium sp. YJ-22]OJU71972.1 MAG: disulfide bond formation protein DsbA [Rhizobiales bacterium 63-7]
MAFTFKPIAAAVLALSMGVAAPAMALDDKQKEEIGQFIKEYLIQNPEIMLDVQNALQAKQEAARTQASAEAVAANKKAIFSDSGDMILGNPKGDVTIVEFFDYNCGYCKHALSDMNEIIDADKNVRFVLKELPILGPDSMAAHKVSYAFKALAPEKYGEFHRALLGGDVRATEERAIEVATSLGVKEDALRKQMADKPNDASVKDVYQLAGTLGITGTPSYVIGNEAVFGAVGAEALEEKIGNVRSCGKTMC